MPAAPSRTSSWIHALDGPLVPPERHTRAVRWLSSRVGSGPGRWLVAAVDDVTAGVKSRTLQAGYELVGNEDEALEAAVAMLLVCIAEDRAFELPPEVEQHARSGARQGIAMESLLAVVWGTHAAVQTLLMRALLAIVPPTSLSVEIQRLSDRQLAFMADVTRAVSRLHQQETEAWGRHRSAAIRRALDTLVDGTDLAPDVEDVLGLRLAHHHLGIVLWPVGAVGQLGWTEDSAAWVDDVVDLCGAGRRLVIPRTDGSTEAIWSSPRPAPPATMERLAALAPPAGMGAALGSFSQGPGGLRATIRAARRLHHALGARPVAAVWTADDHLLPALLVEHPEEASSWARMVLRGLTGGDGRSSVLRATLRGFLETGGSRTRAAALLHVAPTTVAYRIAQATDELVEPTEGRRTQLLMALSLVDTFPEMLSQE